MISTKPKAIKVKDPRMNIQWTIFLVMHCNSMISSTPNSKLIHREVQIES